MSNRIPIMGNRIDPASVPGLYRKLGIAPARGYWATKILPLNLGGFPGLPGECLCCLIGIVGADALSFDVAMSICRCSEYPTRAIGASIGLDETYAIGLDVGWEGTDPDDIVDYSSNKVAAFRDDPNFIDGVRDGRAAYRACIEDGLDVREFWRTAGRG